MYVHVLYTGKGDLVGCDISRHLSAAKEVNSGDASDIIVKSSCDVKALTYCDLKCLSIPGLVDVLRLYPEFQDQFAEDILHDLTFNLREGWEADVSAQFSFCIHTFKPIFSGLLFRQSS